MKSWGLKMLTVLHKDSDNEWLKLEFNSSSIWLHNPSFYPLYLYTLLKIM